MVKKEASSKVSKKLPKNLTDEKVQKLLLENFIMLQRVMTDMSMKFDRLSDHMSKLLNLFENSAKSFSDKQPLVTKEDKDFLEKLDRLLEQNKTIAKGLTMMEERARDKISPSQQLPSQQGYQIPKYPSPQQTSTTVEQQFNPSIIESSTPSTQELPSNPNNRRKMLPRF